MALSFTVTRNREEEYAATQGVPSPPRTSVSPPAQNMARSYKTKICRFGDRCPYLVTNKCQFAHSVDELEYWKRVRLDAMVDGRDELGYGAPPPPSTMPRRSSSLNAVDWSEPQLDPFTAAPVAPRQASTSSSDPFGDPWGRLLAKESQSSLANSTGNLSSANYGEPSPSLSNRSVAGGYGEPAGLGLSAASLPYDGGSPYA